MGGGLMQLVAYGAQDVYLTGNPQITFFKAVYKRHTNFAMECIEQVINGSPANDGRSSVTISRNGDLVQEVFLEATIKVEQGESSTVVYPMERVIKDCELSIGGQRIDKHYQRWWRLYSELYHDHAAKDKYSKMTNCSVFDLAEVGYIPLIFFFNRNPGLALPLIALQYHEVRLDFTWTSVMDTSVTETSIKCWANYIYLDTKERRLFAQKSHEYLIEQVQFTGTEAATLGNSKNIRLNYNHPVKELVWCFEGGDGSLLQNLWNMTSNIEVSAGSSNVFYIAHQACPQPHEGVGVVRIGSDADSSIFSEAAVGPLSTFKLQLNGQDRFTAQSGKYFNQVQPYYHHSGNPVPGVYSYSFALKPELHQPSGTCNFSRIDNATAVPTIKAAIAELSNDSKSQMAMFATNYNVLRVMSGMGGLAYSN